MALRERLHRLMAPMSELDQAKLREFCAGQGQGTCTPIGEAHPRQQVSLMGEITSLRIVPREGSSSVEATISDGTGAMTAVWTGRRRIAGIAPGKRLMVSGRGMATGSHGRLLFYNPRYELL